jgi:hypothetical protein
MVLGFYFLILILNLLLKLLNLLMLSSNFLAELKSSLFEHNL